jgi:hypothetical protein
VGRGYSALAAAPTIEAGDLFHPDPNSHPTPRVKSPVSPGPMAVDSLVFTNEVPTLSLSESRVASSAKAYPVRRRGVATPRSGWRTHWRTTRFWGPRPNSPAHGGQGRPSLRTQTTGPHPKSLRAGTAFTDSTTSHWSHRSSFALQRKFERDFGVRAFRTSVLPVWGHSIGCTRRQRGRRYVKCYGPAANVGARLVFFFASKRYRRCTQRDERIRGPEHGYERENLRAIVFE